VQAAVPVLEAYFPAAQLGHEVAPETEYAPSPQIEHAETPVVFENLPARHEAQTVDPVAAW
jgi:hypothetical protein